MQALRNLWRKWPIATTLTAFTFTGTVGYGLHRYYSSSAQLEIKQLTAPMHLQSTSSIIINNQTTKVEQIVKQSQEAPSVEVEVDKLQSEEPKKDDKNEAQTIQKAENEDKKEENSRVHFKKLNELKEWNFEDKLNDGELALIVADFPFTESFELKMIAEVNRLAEQFKGIKIYRKNFAQESNVEYLKNNYKSKIKDQTLFLLKNNYDKSLNNIDFDMFMQYPSLMEIYLAGVNTYTTENISQLQQKLAALSPHESYILYLYDQNQTAEKKRERMMTAKFIEMEMAVSSLTNVKLSAVERSVAVANGLIEESNNRTNSIHLFRKHNIYTPFDPNFYLKNAGSSDIPFHRLADIALFAKGRDSLMIPNYLSSLETFDSLQMSSPYLCTLRIDRNRISDDQYVKLLTIFGNLKRMNVFPQVAFALKVKPVPYGGSQAPQNKDWQIVLTNMDELDKESLMHQIKTIEHLQQLGYKEQQYLTTSQQYLYEHTVADFELVKQFLSKALSGKVSKHYKSEQKDTCPSIKKITANNFNKTVIEDSQDHLVFEYSEFCPTCKEISPVIDGFAKIIQNKGLGLQGLEFHQLNANKNRVKDIISTPYIPNIYYFKQGWKEHGPVRFPIEQLGQQGVLAFYSFCAITKELITIPWKLIDEAVENQQRSPIVEVI